MRQFVDEDVARWIEEIDGGFESDLKDDAKAKDKFKRAVTEELGYKVYPSIEDGYELAYLAIRDFDFEYDGHKYSFSEPWEWDPTVYTFRFI